jgi:LPS-assembly lipoprotein
MTRALMIASLFALAFTLSACGLSPVYGKYTNSNQAAPVAANLDAVYIENIPNRIGQKLRNTLIDRMVATGRNTKADAAYKLEVGTVSESVYGIGIAKDATATRSQIRLNSVFTLTKSGDGTKLLERKITAVSSFNTLASQYTTLVTEDDARDQAIRQLADQITTQLELYFSNPDAFKTPAE